MFKYVLRSDPLGLVVCGFNHLVLVSTVLTTCTVLVLPWLGDSALAGFFVTFFLLLFTLAYTAMIRTGVHEPGYVELPPQGLDYSDAINFIGEDCIVDSYSDGPEAMEYRVDEDGNMVMKEFKAAGVDTQGQSSGEGSNMEGITSPGERGQEEKKKEQGAEGGEGEKDWGRGGKGKEEEEEEEEEEEDEEEEGEKKRLLSSHTSGANGDENGSIVSTTIITYPQIISNHFEPVSLLPSTAVVGSHGKKLGVDDQGKGKQARTRSPRGSNISSPDLLSMTSLTATSTARRSHGDLLALPGEGPMPNIQEEVNQRRHHHHHHHRQGVGSLSSVSNASGGGAGDSNSIGGGGGDGKEWHVCRKCSSYCPPGARHCALCRRCLQPPVYFHSRMVNNCIGCVNVRFYFQYAVYSLLLFFSIGCFVLIQILAETRLLGARNGKGVASGGMTSGEVKTMDPDMPGGEAFSKNWRYCVIVLVVSLVYSVYSLFSLYQIVAIIIEQTSIGPSLNESGGNVFSPGVVGGSGRSSFISQHYGIVGATSSMLNSVSGFAMSVEYNFNKRPPLQKVLKHVFGENSRMMDYVLPCMGGRTKAARKRRRSSVSSHSMFRTMTPGTSSRMGANDDSGFVDWRPASTGRGTTTSRRWN